MIQSVDRAASILLELQGARHLSLSELAGRLGLANSTVHGIAQTLLRRGLVEQDRAGRYALGAGVLRLGNVYLDNNELRLRAQPWTDALAARTGFAVRVAVPLEHDMVVVLHVLRPDGSLQMREIGIAIPQHGSALGKAVLAFSADADERLRAPAALTRMTGRTITDPDVLVRDLPAIRAEGIAIAEDEAVLGESDVAGPIFDGHGHVIGSVGVVIPTTELPVDLDVVDAVRRAAIAISRSMGATVWPDLGRLEDEVRTPA